MPIVCSECGEEFAERKELFAHIRNSHGDEASATATSSNGIPPSPTHKARRDPRKMFEDDAAEDIVEKEEPQSKFDWDKLSAYLPLTLSVFWIFFGTVFYAVHDHLGWARALFMSVNVGWSINWPMDGLSDFDNPMSKLFALYHTSIGVLFAGVTVLYMAQEVGKNKDNWILQIIKIKELDATADTEGCWDSIQGLIKVHLPTLRIIAVFLVWFVFGLLWFSFTVTEYTVAKNVDFVFSTLTASGYIALPSSVSAYQLIITALYTNFGVPLLSIALGLFISLAMESPEDNLIFHQIIAPVTGEEISFMQEFCIENGDGVVDCSEFIILAIVRIGAVAPELVTRINERFRELDRKHRGKILYDDLIVGRQKESPRTMAPEVVTQSSAHSKAHNIFKTRSKAVFAVSGSAAAAEIRANIAKIENFRKTSNPSSRNSSGRSSVIGIQSAFCYSSDSNDSCCSNDSHDENQTPTWRNPKKAKRRSNNRSGRANSSRANSGRANSGRANSGRASSKYEADEEEDENAPPSWRNPKRIKKFSNSGHFSDKHEEGGDVECFTSERSSGKNTAQSSFQSTAQNSVKSTAQSSVKVTDRSSDLSTECVSLSGNRSINDTLKCESFEEVNEEKEEEKKTPGEMKMDNTSLHRPSSSLSSRSSSRRVCPEPFYMADKDDLESMGSSRWSIHPDDPFYKDADIGDIEANTPADRPVMLAQTKSVTTVKSSSNSIKTKKEQELDIFNAPHATVDLVSEDGSTRSKHHAKMQKAIEERRSSKREAFQNKRKSPWKRMVLSMKKKAKSSYAITFYVWFLWLTVGTIFYCLEENLTFCQGVYVSTSVGYGIFWYDARSTNSYAKVFLTFHFSVGVIGVSFAMAVIARSLVSSRKEWFDEAKQKRQLQDGLVTYFDYYWPKLYVHFFFLLWMMLGIIWGTASIKWSFLDAWLFCMSTMATGGLVSLPSSGVHEMDYIFVSIYIIIGAPLMAISCGINARSISNYGRSSKLEAKLNADMTEDELVMMRHLGLENDDGNIDNAEFTLLILVRIGALNPDLISVLFDRYHEINMQGTVTYDYLQRGGSFMGNALLKPVAFQGSLKSTFSGSFKGSALVKKLRLDSMGG